MARYLTTYTCSDDTVRVFTEENHKGATRNCDDWVWQFADTPEQAKSQHFTKLDEWEIDPTKETY